MKESTFISMRSRLLRPAILAFAGLCSSASFADTSPVQPSAGWWSTLTYAAQVDAGGVMNTDSPDDNRNFGRLFDDKSNGVQLNQVLLTVQRPMDSTVKGYDLGFQLQGMYGSDARYTHFLNEFQNTVGDAPNQIDLVQAVFQLHTPWLTDGGLDIQAGQYVSPEGAEGIDPYVNYFYSHSYIFNFGVPFKNTGVLFNLHVCPALNLEAGIDTGVNTSLGGGDNNSRLSFQGAIGLNLLGGNLTTLITTHIGPEDAQKAVQNGLLPSTVNANSALRALSDITTTWKVNDRLTLINDINWIHDDALNAGNAANAFGIAQYALYKINDTYTLTGRAEIFRDVDGVFVTQSGNNVDFLRGEQGLLAQDSRSVSGGRTTYGEVSAGVNIKPGLGIPHITNITLRPELRYDASLNGTHPFNDSKDEHMFTAGMDLIIGF